MQNGIKNIMNWNADRKGADDRGDLCPVVLVIKLKK